MAGDSLNNEILAQITSLGTFIVTGIIISIFFDFFRVLRKTFNTSDLVTYIEDSIFWIITGIILLFTIFKFNNGELRLYILFGLFTGIVIYILTLSRYFIKINTKILSFLKWIIFSILIKPFNMIKKFFMTVKNIFTNIYKKSLLKRKNNVKINNV